MLFFYVIKFRFISCGLLFFLNLILSQFSILHLFYLLELSCSLRSAAWTPMGPEVALLFVHLFLFLIGIHLFVVPPRLLIKSNKNQGWHMKLLKTTSPPAKQKLISCGHSNSLFPFPTHNPCFVHIYYFFEFTSSSFLLASTNSI
jgi:hypothetical protein